MLKSFHFKSDHQNMIKKILLSAFLALIFAIPTHAASTEDFSQMNPTVKITSYKKLFIDNVLAYQSGSGTIISADGIVVTNHHVIFDEEEFKPLDAFEICITLDIQKEPVCKYTASLIASDKDMDIALLKINNKDVFGQALPSLKFLNYKTTAAPKEQTEIRVAGYPGSGGNTITMTKGQISGFDEYNNFNYFKTDTDFDHGSSGGTALDPDGNFIGIPTYIRSYAENVGYFLDLREAQKWIDDNIQKSPKPDPKTEKFLQNDLARLSKANDDLKYTQPDYPYSEITLPKGWEFEEIDDESFFVSQKNLSNPVSLNIHTLNYQFEINQGYMDKLDEQLESIKENYPDYKKEDVTIAEQKAWKITYTSSYSKNTAYYVPYGYSIIGISYSIDLNEIDKQTADIKPALDSFRFTKSPVKDPILSGTVKFDEPPFEISAFGNFRIQENKDTQAETLLAEASQKDNFEGSFAVYYEPVPKDERQLSAKDRLDNVTKNLYSKKLVYKNDEVVLGGLSGFLYTYEYEGDKFQEKRKAIDIVIRNGDHEFILTYDDKTKEFDKNLPVVQKMLDSFQFNGDSAVKNSKNSYGNLGFTFNDIQYHRFASAIGDLAEKGIVKGYEDGGFHPEQLVTRTEALKIILESKNHLETEKGSKKVVDFSKYEKNKSSFKDVDAKNPLLKYIEYSKEKRFTEGYSGNIFKPNQNVNLVEALKLVMSAYEIPVWSGTTEPWFKKYMDKAYELGLLVRGLEDPSHYLTRGELADIVDEVYKQADNSAGFGY